MWKTTTSNPQHSTLLSIYGGSYMTILTAILQKRICIYNMCNTVFYYLHASYLLWCCLKLIHCHGVKISVMFCIIKQYIVHLKLSLPLPNKGFGCVFILAMHEKQNSVFYSSSENLVASVFKLTWLATKGFSKQVIKHLA